MNYGFVITRQGLNLITKLLIPTDLVLTRVMVGNGRVEENPDPIWFTDLISPIAQAASTTPIVNNRQLEFTVEYRNDMGTDLGTGGGLATGFWLNEFGVFALDPDEGEILLYYASLGDYPQWVQPFTPGMLDVRRYPISIGLSSDATVVLQYPSVAFLTSEDLERHNKDPNAHNAIIAGLQRQIDELKVFLSPFRIGTLVVNGNANEAQVQLTASGNIETLVLNRNNKKIGEI